MSVSEITLSASGSNYDYNRQKWDSMDRAAGKLTEKLTSQLKDARCVEERGRGVANGSYGIKVTCTGKPNDKYYEVRGMKNPKAPQPKNMSPAQRALLSMSTAELIKFRNSFK